MLELHDVHTYYEESYIIQGISLEVKESSVVALLGRNGMGKTTIIRAIIGLTPPRRGEIFFKGVNIVGMPSNQIAQMGMGLVPQGRRIFPSLSVTENLTMAARSGKPDSWTLERVYSLFPILKERAKSKGNLLSGGEQQMLTIARALMTNPELILMDEPSEGLAPIIVEEIGEIMRELKESGFSILLVEQHLSLALGVAGYVYIISAGKIVHQSISTDLKYNEEIKAKYLGVGN